MWILNLPGLFETKALVLLGIGHWFLDIGRFFLDFGVPCFQTTDNTKIVSKPALDKSSIARFSVFMNYLKAVFVLILNFLQRHHNLP